MSPKQVATIVGLCFCGAGLAGTGCAAYHSERAEHAAEEQAEAGYDRAKHEAKAKYEKDEEACEHSLDGDAERACKAQAKADYDQALADAKAAQARAHPED